jgi:hypothetical protein
MTSIAATRDVSYGQESEISYHAQAHFLCHRHMSLRGCQNSGTPRAVRITSSPRALEAYCWGNKIRNYYRCKACGCVTHYKHRKARDWNVVGVNGSNFDIEVIEAARIRSLDGARSWKFID